MYWRKKRSKSSLSCDRHGAWSRNSAKWHIRFNAGSKLVSRYSTLSNTHCQQHCLSSGKASFARLAQLTNARHRGKGVLVAISATCPFSTDCP
jgi:hypothetical protein